MKDDKKKNPDDIDTSEGVEYDYLDLTRRKVDYRRLLFNTYKAALEIVGTKVDENVEKQLWFYLNTKTDGAIEKKVLKLSAHEQEHRERVMLYSMMLFGKEHVEWLGGRITAVLNATKDEKIDEEKTVEINGNIFVYNEKEIDIAQYMDVLENVGNSVKDETMYVCLDEGELVVY